MKGNTGKHFQSRNIKCVCLNARSILNKKNELDIMVDEIKPHIIGITESWANNDITNIKSDRTKVKQCRRDFGKGNYKEIRKSLAIIDGNDKMKNKTATECWNIFRGELDSEIDFL